MNGAQIHSMCFLRLMLVMIAVICGVSSATCMTFKTEWNPEEKISVIVAEGRIEEGDAQRLENVIPLAARDRYGNIQIYLNSFGGGVAAAFEIVEVMDREEFSALVPSDARCASACASILYISARFHQVLGTGLLGIHSCYRADKNTGSPEPDSFCNEVIAQNAIQHGTSYGAVQMWQRHTAPQDMAWIGKEVACEFGLCGPPGFRGTLAVPSFDCKTAKLSSEAAICSNKRLARHEAELSSLYVELIREVGAPEKETLRNEQRAWLKYRNSCQGADLQKCLLQRMKTRWNELMEKKIRYLSSGH